jgi:hypothetical protein
MKKNYFGVVHQTIFYQIIKISKRQLLLKYCFGARGVKFLEKRRENVQILQAQGYVGLCPKNIYSFWIKLFYFILEVASIDH